MVKIVHRRSGRVLAIVEAPNLGGADLAGSSLRGAHLYGWNLQRADLRGSDLSKADLRSADLAGADLRGADLRGAWIWAVRLSNAVYDAETRWPNAVAAWFLPRSEGCRKLPARSEVSPAPAPAGAGDEATAADA